MRVSAMVLVPVAVLGLLEVLLRVAGVGYATDYFQRSTVKGTTYLVPNPHFSYRFFPPALARAPFPQRILPAKPPGTYRIFLFGESAAYGDPDPAYGVGRYLEVLLGERYPGTDFEVVCTAMTAINSHAILPIARECADLEADLWIVYMGNNEMIGAYGAGTAFSSKAPPLPMVRAMLALRRTRTGQLLAGLMENAREGPESWDGINMFSKHLGPEDPARLTSYRNFQGNLEDILETASEAGIPLLLSTVASNLKHCAPFSSVHDRELKAPQIHEWKNHYEEGKALEEEGDLQAALRQYNAAAAIDDQYAELLFRMGRCHLALEDSAKARLFFKRARDMDGLAVRADSRINERIRDAASRYPVEAVELVDAVEELSDECVSEIPGHELFYEHVHFTPQGNYRLALLLAEKVRGRLPEAITATDLLSWPEPETCERRLALGLWDQHRLWHNMKSRLSVPPHTLQLDHEENLEHCGKEARAVIARIDNNTPRKDRELYLKAIRESPEDNLLHARFGQYLEATGARREAIREFEIVCELLPDLAWPHYYLGEIYARAGLLEEAAESFRRALQIRSDFREAREALEAIPPRPA